jgi:hypothetical protein
LIVNAYLKWRDVGILISRLLNDLPKVRAAFDFRFSQFWVTFGTAVFAFMFSLISDWKLTLIVSPFIPLVCYGSLY